MTSEAERDALLQSALQEVVSKITVHPDLVAGTLVAGGVFVVCHPDLGPLQRSFLAEGPSEGRIEQVDQWLREQLDQARAIGDPVMLGTASTAKGLFNLGRPQSILVTRFEDGSGTFFSGVIPYELRDGVAQWGDLMAGEGFDQAPRLWPAPAPQSPAPRQAGDGDLPAETAGAAEAIATYQRTGTSLRALDAAIATLEACLRRYAWDHRDERYASLVLTLSRGLLARFRRIGDPSDARRAAEGCRELTTTSAENSTWRARAYTLLILALTAEHHRTGASVPLDEAIEIGEGRLTALGDTLTDPELTLALTQALLDRHMLYGVSADPDRAKELILDMRRESWNDVDWAAQAFDCLRQIHARTPGVDPAVTFRAAFVTWSIAERRGIGGDDLFRYATAYMRELLAAYIRDENPEHLRQALETTEEALDLDKPGETPRLTRGAPARVPLVEVWADCLEWARYRTDPLIERFDPDGTRLLSAREELVAAAGDAAPRRAMALHRMAGARRAVGDRGGALGAERDALAAWEDVFAGATTAERLGNADLGAELYQACFGDLLAGLPGAERDAMVNGLWEALLLSEAPKSRLLTEALGRGELPAPPAITAELLARERDLVQRLTDIDEHDLVAETDRARIPTPPQASRRQELRSELGAVWDEMVKLGAEASEYVALRRGRPLDRERIQELIAALPSGTTVLSAFDTPGATNFVFASPGAPGPGIVGIRLGPDDWAAITGRMWREIPLARGHDRGATWLSRLQELLDKLTEVTRDSDRVIVTPQGSTRALPWPVIGRELERRRGSPLSLVLEPALGVLEVLRRRATDSAGTDVVAGDPLGDLAFARDEAESVGRRLGVAPLIGPDATRGALAAAAPAARVIHLAAHAQFDPVDPLGSAVLLADGSWTARDLIATTLSSQLVVLSACESGRLEPLRGDEVAGLSMAILHAGARRVLVTLWPVDDRAAQLFMEHFYRLLEAQLDCDRAVREAARLVEAEPGFDHPYYWGGYVLLGDYTWGQPSPAPPQTRGAHHAASGA